MLTATAPHFAHATCSRVWLKILFAQRTLCNVKASVRPFIKNCLSLSRIMSPSQSSLLDPPPFPSPNNSLLLCFYRLAVTIHHLIHGPQDFFGRLATQGPLTRREKKTSR